MVHGAFCSKHPLLPFLLRKHSIAYKSILNFSRCTRHLLCTLLRNVNPVRVTLNHPTEVISNIGKEIVIRRKQSHHKRKASKIKACNIV